MWQIVTGVDFEQLDEWLESINEDGEKVKITTLKKAVNSLKESPVEGLAVADFEAVLKKLLKHKESRIRSSLFMNSMVDQIVKQYGQKNNQELDLFLILKVRKCYVGEKF